MEEKIKIAVKELKDELIKVLSIYKGYKGNECAYEVRQSDLRDIYVLFVIPTDRQCPFITMAAIESIKEVYNSQELKEYMYFGVETYIYTDMETGCQITLPCISFHIDKKKVW